MLPGYACKRPLDACCDPLARLVFILHHFGECEKLSANMELHLQVIYELHVTYSFPKRGCVMDLFLEKTPFSLILMSTT